MAFGLSSEVERFLQTQDVQVHACKSCGCNKWHIAVSGDVLCANCARNPGTLAVVPLMVPTSVQRIA